MPEPRRSGSAMARVAMARPTETHPKSAGAGPGTATRGSASPRHRVVNSARPESTGMQASSDGYAPRMATLQDVDRIMGELPEVAEGEHHGHPTWAVRDKGIAWLRPFSKADLKRFGDQAPPV